METSSPHREKGNDIYRKTEVNKNKLENSEYQASLELAIISYKEGLSNSPSLTEEAFLFKNIGFVAKKIALSFQDEIDLEKAMYNYQLSVECSCRAIERGFYKGDIDSIEYSVLSCIDDLIQLKKEIGWLYKIENICNKIPKGLEKLKVSSLVSIAKASFNTSVPLLENNNCQESVMYLRLCDSFCKKALKIIESSVGIIVTEEFEELMRSVKHHKILLEAIAMTKKGDEHTLVALEDSDILSVDTVWIAIDYYKQAISLLKGKELEYEAIALGRLGRIYHKIIKNDEKARLYYHTCMELAITKGIAQKENFLLVAEALKALQHAAAQKEELEKEQKTQALRTCLAPKLQALEEASRGTTLELICFIAKNHPPPDITLTPIPPKVESRDAEKTFLLKFCRHYHQDKQQDKSSEWLFLAEEISKYLNEKLEMLK